MSQTLIPADQPAALGFELERFGWAGDERLEVTGRWFGVRGRRFVRPTLTLRAAGRRRRMIALLEHKPWAAADAEAWTAAFAWRGDREDVTTARLEVAPDVVLELPAPGDTAEATLIHPAPRARPPRRAEPPAEPAPPPADSEPAAAEDTAPAPPPAGEGVRRDDAQARADRAIAAARAQADAEIAAVRERSTAEVAVVERSLAEAEQRAEARAAELRRLQAELASAQAIPERSRRELVEARRRAERAEQATTGLRQRVTDANELTTRLERRLVAAAEHAERLERRIAELETAGATQEFAPPSDEPPPAEPPPPAAAEPPAAEAEEPPAPIAAARWRLAASRRRPKVDAPSWAVRGFAVLVAVLLLVALAVALVALL